MIFDVFLPFRAAPSLSRRLSVGKKESFMRQWRATTFWAVTRLDGAGHAAVKADAVPTMHPLAAEKVDDVQLDTACAEPSTGRWRPLS